MGLAEAQRAQVTTVDHNTHHVWARMATGRIRCAVMMCNARPEPADVAKLEADEAARQATRKEIRYSH
jgi:hypothetical protein